MVVAANVADADRRPLSRRAYCAVRALLSVWACLRGSSGLRKAQLPLDGSRWSSVLDTDKKDVAKLVAAAAHEFKVKVILLADLAESIAAKAECVACVS